MLLFVWEILSISWNCHCQSDLFISAIISQSVQRPNPKSLLSNSIQYQLTFGCLAIGMWTSSDFLIFRSWLRHCVWRRFDFDGFAIKNSRHRCWAFRCDGAVAMTSEFFFSLSLLWSLIKRQLRFKVWDWNENCTVFWRWMPDVGYQVKSRDLETGGTLT